MSYKYQIEKGQEHRIFAGAKNLGDGTVESDTELNSVYLTLIQPIVQPVAPTVAPSVTPPAPQVANPVPPVQTNTPNNEGA